MATRPLGEDELTADQDDRDRRATPEDVAAGHVRGPRAERTGPGDSSLASRLVGAGVAARPIVATDEPGRPLSPETSPTAPVTDPIAAVVADPAASHPPGRRVRQGPGPVTGTVTAPGTVTGTVTGTGIAPVRPATTPPVGEPAPLGSDTLLRSRGRAAPLTGWRRVLKAMTFGAVEPGPSPAQVRLAERTGAIRAPIVGTHRVAVISLKGGVGKTTTTMMLGSTLASLRGDRVIALDANPDAGTLGDRLPRRTTATVRDLLTHYSEVRSWADLAAYTSQSSSRLEVIANDVDPSVSTAVTAADYLRIVEMLGRYYSVVLTDSGTGLLHDAMNGILNAADTLVLVSSASVDGARSASTTLDWLDAQGYGQLVRSAVTVVSSVRPGGREVNVDAIVSYFATRCRAVVRIPFDPHLETGAETDLDALAPSTRDAYLDLAVAVAGDFDRGDEQARARRRGRPHTR